MQDNIGDLGCYRSSKRQIRLKVFFVLVNPDRCYPLLPTYRVGALRGRRERKVLPIRAIIDSGGGLNSKIRDFLHQLGWSTTVLDVDIPRLR